ncbi:MAG: ATP-binding protein [Lentisphaeria bacterium]|nr:ATP-binding protein [Lentisphaeria bacterium]
MENKNTFLNRLIERLDRVDSASVQNYLLKLVREKGFLQTVFDSIREGVLVIDRDINLIYCNLAARHFLGLPDNAEGQRVSRFLRDIDWLGIMEADPGEWQRISLREVEVFYPENRFITFYIVPLAGETDKVDDIPMAAIILRDVTEIRQKNQETVESERVEAITKLAAGVAHELGNPLNSLKIHLQILAVTAAEAIPDKKQADDAEEMLDICLHEVQRLDSIVSNFLKAVRPAPPQLAQVEMDKIIADAIGFMRREIEDRGIRVEAALPKRLPMILADPALLKQAFYNIIKNSIQAMAEGGLLSIECLETEHYLEVRFADTGTGIAQADLPHIVDPYFTTKADGTGLGLLVVERICRSHGAEFSIESKEGDGTVFTLRFPLRERRARLLVSPTDTQHDDSAD